MIFKTPQTLEIIKQTLPVPIGHKDKSTAWVINGAMGKMFIYHALLYTDIAIRENILFLKHRYTPFLIEKRKEK